VQSDISLSLSSEKRNAIPARSQKIPIFAVNTAGPLLHVCGETLFGIVTLEKDLWFSRSTPAADSIGISQPVCTRA